MGRRRFVHEGVADGGPQLENHARLASMDIHSVTSRALNAQVSTTCVPCVLMIVMR